MVDLKDITNQRKLAAALSEYEEDLERQQMMAVLMQKTLQQTDTVEDAFSLAKRAIEVGDSDVPSSPFRDRERQKA